MSYDGLPLELGPGGIRFISGCWKMCIGDWVADATTTQYLVQCEGSPDVVVYLRTGLR